MKKLRNSSKRRFLGCFLQPAASAHQGDLDELNSTANNPLIWQLLFILSNILVASTFELSHDEAYYWLWSRFPDWGYFDHPPLIAWLISLSPNWGGGEWSVRLAPFVVLIFIIWFVGRQLIPSNRQWAWWAGWCVFPMLSVIPTLALPDSALLSTALLFIWSIERFTYRESLAAAAAVGISAGLLLYAKYHGGLLIIGVVAGAPHLLRRRNFWIAAVVGLILLLPHLEWQWAHRFVTFDYHLFHAHKGGFSLYRPLEFLAGQALNPGIFLAPWAWRRVYHFNRDDLFERALVGMTATTLVVFLCFSFFKSIEGNWTLAAYLCLLVLIVRKPGLDWPRGRQFKVLGLASVAIILSAKLLVAVPGSEQYIRRLNELRGWRKWSVELAQATKGCELVANRYQIAAKLSFYLKRQVLSLNVGGRSNQFDIWDLQNTLKDKSLCWIGATTDFPAERWTLPTGNSLRLARNISLEEILLLKNKSRWSR